MGEFQLESVLESTFNFTFSIFPFLGLVNMVISAKREEVEQEEQILQVPLPEEKKKRKKRGILAWIRRRFHKKKRVVEEAPEVKEVNKPEEVVEPAEPAGPAIDFMGSKDFKINQVVIYLEGQRKILVNECKEMDGKLHLTLICTQRTQVEALRKDLESQKLSLDLEALLAADDVKMRLDVAVVADDLDRAELEL